MLLTRRISDKDKARAAALALRRVAGKLRITPGQRQHIVLLARYRTLTSLW